LLNINKIKRKTRDFLSIKEIFLKYLLKMRIKAKHKEREIDRERSYDIFFPLSKETVNNRDIILILLSLCYLDWSIYNNFHRC